MGQWVGATLTGSMAVALFGAIALIVRAGLVRIPTDHPDVHCDLDQLFFQRFGHLVSEPAEWDDNATGVDGAAGHDVDRDLAALSILVSDVGPLSPSTSPSPEPAQSAPHLGAEVSGGCSRLGPAA